MLGLGRVSRVRARQRVWVRNRVVVDSAGCFGAQVGLAVAESVSDVVVAGGAGASDCGEGWGVSSCMSSVGVGTQMGLGSGVAASGVGARAPVAVDWVLWLLWVVHCVSRGCRVFPG